MSSSKTISKIASTWLEKQGSEGTLRIRARALSFALASALLDLADEQPALASLVSNATRELVVTPAEEREAKQKSIPIELQVPQGTDPLVKMRALSLAWSGAILDLTTKDPRFGSFETLAASVNMKTRNLVLDLEVEKAAKTLGRKIDLAILRGLPT